MVKIKICGITRLCDADALNEYMPEYCGFVLSPGFRRSVTPQTALEIRSRLKPEIQTVGVFVNESEEFIKSCVKSGAISVVQLHGGESTEFIAGLSGITVIKSFICTSPPETSGFENADYYLFDSGKGTGKTFPLQNIPAASKPFFLAGGLNESNVQSAIKSVSPFCVDISSGVETNGFKDKKKIETIIRRIRNE